MAFSAFWSWFEARPTGRRPGPARRGPLALEELEDRVVLSGTASPVVDVSIPGLSSGPAVIRGTVFVDRSGTGQFVAGDPGIAGRTVFLDLNHNGKLDPGDPSTVTGANGAFSFSNLAPGTYTVSQVVPAGWTATSYVVAASVPASSPADQLIGLDQLRANPRFANLLGQGESVVVLDTGIDDTHPFFGPLNSQGVADSIVYQHDFTTGSNVATDVDGHGTYVASIIASRDSTYPGIAPGVNLIILKVLDDQGNGEFGNIDQALRWVIANVNNYHIACVNMSFGDNGDYTTPQSLYGIGPDLATLEADNVVVVAAAGNGYSAENSQPGLSYPAIDPNVIAVGAVWDANHGGPWVWNAGARDNTTGSDQIVSFSQRLPGGGEVFAPGTLMTGAAPNDGTAQLSGTSTAAAVVSGVVALAQQLAMQTLGHQLDTTQMRDLLNSTGAAIIDGQTEDDNVAHTGATFERVDVFTLAEAIVGLGSVSAGPTAGSRVVSLPAGSTVSVSLGSFQLGRVSGQVFSDANGNGKLDAGDPGLAGRVVFADLNGDGKLSPGDPSTITDSQGRFVLTGLPAGAVTIRLVLLAEEQTTTPLLHLTDASGLNLTGVLLGVRSLVPAPWLSGNGQGETIPEGSSDPSGVNIFALLGNTFHSTNPHSLSGIAIVGATGGAQGQWQFSLNGGRTWENLGLVSLSNARLLSDNNKIRFVPAANFYGTATLTYRAWNQTSGQAAGVVNLSAAAATGGTTAFSSAAATANVVVTYVHHAPVLSGPGQLSLPTANAANPPGESVANILAGTIAYLDPKGKIGMALVGASGQGTWQYSRDGGKTWSDLGDVSYARVRLLAGTDLLRFLPAKNWNGKAQLTYRAWDETTGVAGSVLDLSSWALVGSTSAYSKEVESAALNPVTVASGSGGSGPK